MATTQLNTGNSFAGDMISVDFDALVAAAGELRATAGKLTSNQTALESSLKHTDAMTGPAAVAINTSKASLFAAIQSTINTLNSWSTVVENGSALQKQQEFKREAALTIQNMPGSRIG